LLKASEFSVYELLFGDDTRPYLLIDCVRFIHHRPFVKENKTKLALESIPARVGIDASTTGLSMSMKCAISIGSPHNKS
jgi:hypothetical protein